MDDFFELEGTGAERAPLFSGGRTADAAEPARPADPGLALNELHAEYAQKLFSYTL